MPVLTREQAAVVVATVESGKEADTVAWRWRIFCALFIGELVFNTLAKGMAVIGPILVEDGMSKAQLGVIVSAFSVSYSISKTICGIATDFVSSRIMFAVGLLGCSLCSMAFGMATTPGAQTAIWALNGFFQGAGWPCVARILLRWWPAEDRAKVWARCSAGTSVGSGATPALLSVVVEWFGWRDVLFILGFNGVACAVGVYWALRESPAVVGLAEVELPSLPSLASTRRRQSTRKGRGGCCCCSGVDDELMSTYRLHVLSNGFLWQMSACGCCLYFALQASSNWSLMFLQKGRGFSSSAAVTCYFMQFAGSVVGSLICDPIYQSLSKRSHGDDSQAAERLSTAISISSSGMMEKDESLGMNRARVLMSMACVLLAVVALVGLWTVPTVAAGQKTGTVPLSWATLSLFLFGASVFIPKIIFGVAVRESLPPAASGAGGGVLELLSETGAAMSGFPIGLLLDRPGADGWLLMFVLLLASCLTMLLLMTPLLFSGHASKA